VNWLKKHLRVLSLLLVFLLLFSSLYWLDLSPTDEEMHYGVTFSKDQAINLKLDWRKTYLAILDELKIDNLRLIARWDQLEKEADQFDFADLDWQIAEAAKRGAAVVLVIGQRVPRWPECFIPDWAEQLESSKYEAALLSYLATIIKHYQNYPNISHWQIENEPFLASFGICPPVNESLFQQEIALVRENDSRPIITTDSGELGAWRKASKQGDVFGTTMYRKVWHKYLGYFSWPLPAVFYRLKGQILTAKKAIYVMELQAEPWISDFDFIIDVPISTQLAVFNEDDLKRNISYARKGGFSKIYLWGVEWWYWLKANGQPELWNTAEKIWQTN